MKLLLTTAAGERANIAELKIQSKKIIMIHGDSKQEIEISGEIDYNDIEILRKIVSGEFSVHLESNPFSYPARALTYEEKYSGDRYELVLKIRQI